MHMHAIQQSLHYSTRNSGTQMVFQGFYIFIPCRLSSESFKGRTSRKLIGGEGGWGGGEVQKNIRTPINRKKYSCYGLNKIHTRNLITPKKFLRLENSPPPPSPPPITFLMVRL